MPKLSIIMTVYNVEPYLSEGIQSILAQSFQDFELILVDDGSTDQTWAICQSFQRTDLRIRAIHKENGGTASGRNVGIEAAQGQWIGFVDGDDWIESDFYEVLISLAEDFESDIAACGFVKIKDREKLQFNSESGEVKVYGPKEGIAATFEKDKMRYSPCNKIYKASLFNEIRYPEGILFEDKATTYRLFHRANQVIYMNTPKYHYYVRDDSAMRKPLQPIYFTFFKVNEDLIAFLRENYPDLVPLAEASYREECINALERMGIRASVEDILSGN